MHLKHVGMGGNREKPNPCHLAAIPACSACHGIDHSSTAKETGREKLEKKVNLYKINSEYLRKFILHDGVTLP